MPSAMKRTQRYAKRLFRWCTVDGVLDEERIRQVVRGIIARHPRGYLGLLTQFHRLLKLENARRTATITSALPLSADLEARVHHQLRRAYGDELITSFSENPDLIGGMRIQIGCDVYDGSVRSRLALLERSLGIESFHGPA